MRKWWLSLILFVQVIAVTPTLADDVPCQLERLFAADGHYEDMFSVSAALTGDWAFFGVEKDDPAGDNSGSVGVYRQTAPGEWAFEALLVPADGAAGDNFGAAVAVVISDNHNSRPREKLLTPVTVDQARALVGAPRDMAVAVHLFTAAGSAWSQAWVARPGGGGGDFGWAVDQDGNLAADVTPPPWNLPPYPPSGDAAISGDRLAISAHHDSPGPYDVGAVYIFRYSGSSWYQEAKLTAGDATSNQEFGESLAFDGTRLLVGAPGNGDYPYTLDGAVYLYRRDGTLWVEVTKYEAYDGADSDFYGHALALDGLTAFCSAPGDDDSGSGSGSVYNIGRR